EVLAGCEQIGDSYGAARVLLALTHIHLNRGELAVALKTIDRSRAIRAQLGSAQATANADTVRAEVLLTLGRIDEARELIDAVVAGTPRTPQTAARRPHRARPPPAPPAVRPSPTCPAWCGAVARKPVAEPAAGLPAWRRQRSACDGRNGDARTRKLTAHPDASFRGPHCPCRPSTSESWRMSMPVRPA